MDKDGKQVPWDTDYYFVPGFNRYGIARNGVLKNLATNRIVRWVKSKPAKESIRGGYSVAAIVNSDGVRKGISRHRLLALTFIPCPGDVSDFTVNHKNGIPGDDDLDNLEWCSYSDNVKHAYATGLIKEGLNAVTVRWWRDNKEETYSSLAAAARAIGKTESTVRQRLTRNNGVAFSDGLQMKTVHSGDWICPSDKIAKVRVNVLCTATHTETGKVFLHDSARSLAKVLGLNPVTAAKRIRTGDSKPLDGFILKSI